MVSGVRYYRCIAEIHRERTRAFVPRLADGRYRLDILEFRQGSTLPFHALVIILAVIPRGE